MGSYKGWTAKKDDLKFISEFEKLGFLIISTKVDHEYAHCSRCHGAVVFRATKQWFMKVEHMKEELIKANQKINWVPDWGGNRWFDSWLRNLQDSSISRQRYWGTPLPFWKCEKCGELTVVGSIKELKKLSGKLPSNLHKPWIDKVTMKCKCGGKKIRTPDILDVWLDAACASWACLYYPAKDKFLKSYFPADLILEGKDQIRGWFNVLSTIGWIGFKQIPFKACYMHGMINDAQGRKMSKSLGNYILPEEVIGKYGADTMRYYMIQAANPGLDLNYNLEDTKTKYRLLEVLWNTHIYLINYSKSEGIDPTKLKNPKLATEEKYILSRSNSTIQKVTELYDAYHINEVPGEIEALFLDVSRKYIQIIRDKLAAGTKEEKEAVIFTLYNILTDILKMFATVAPFATEQMYQNLKEAFGLKEESVHLLSWPKANKKLINKKIEEEFVAADKLISEILSAREKLQRNVRWPIKSITVYVPHEVKEYKALIKQIDSQEEIIKRITNTMDIEATDKQIKGITKTVKPDYEKLAPRFKKDIAEVISKIVQMSPESILKKIEEKGKFEITLQSGLKAEIKSEDFITDLGLPKNIFAVKSNNYTVYLNTEETSDILSLGFAREITRKVQALRKKAGLQKQDRIKLTIEASPELKALLEKNLNEISVKTGLDGLDFNKVGKQKFSEGFKIRDEEIAIGFDFVTKK